MLKSNNLYVGINLLNKKQYLYLKDKYSNPNTNFILHSNRLYYLYNQKYIISLSNRIYSINHFLSNIEFLTLCDFNLNPIKIPVGFFLTKNNS